MTDSKLSTSGAFLIYALGTLVLIFILAPLVVVLSISFSTKTFAMFPPKGFTLHWYANVVANQEFRSALEVSVILALAATLASCAIGLPAALALNRMTGKAKQVLENLITAPLVLPLLIVGLALLQFFSKTHMQNTPVNLFIGHILVTLPYMLRTISASLLQVDAALEEAARTLGASGLVLFRRVIVPQIIPGIAAGSLFAFMISFDDFPVSMWLADSETMPLPLFLSSDMTRVFDPSIATMSTLTIIIGVVAVLGLEKIVGLRKAMGI